MAEQTIDMLRTISVPLPEREILILLRAMRQDLARLVELEEERREGERRYEALAEALQPSAAEPELIEFDWYRDDKGWPRERGTDRLLTQDEYAAITYSPRREARRRQ